MANFDRVIWIVLDSVGIGELPDAADYGDVGRSTLGHIAESRALAVPNLMRLGLANIAPLAHLQAAAAPIGAYGKGATHSPGKDTTTGHWEMAGIWLPQAFPSSFGARASALRYASPAAPGQRRPMPGSRCRA